MKIDNETVNVLKNFAKVNQSILINEGNVLKTISTGKSIMAKSTVKTAFTKKFAIYNLDQFISLLSTFTDPDLKFEEKYVNIYENNRKSRFTYADESTVTKAPEKDIVLPTSDVVFKLNEKELRLVEKDAGILSLPDIAVVGDGKTISLVATDSKDPTSNGSEVQIGETDKVFRAVFKSENLRIAPGDYEVTISSKGISRFVSDEIEYFIVVEGNYSTF